MILRSHKQRGFTLIELVMTLFIIGLVSAAVVWTIAPQPTTARDEALRLATLLQRTSDESLLTGRIMGVSVQPDHYSVQSFGLGGWSSVTQPAEFQPRWFEDSLTVAVVRDGTELDWDTHETAAGEGAVSPNLIFFPNGINSDFLVTVQDSTRAFNVTADAKGRIVLRDSHDM